MGIIEAAVLQAANLALVLLFAPLLTGIVRKTKARLQLRRGATIFQPYRDIVRLLRKEAVVASNASWLFRSGPYLVFAFTWLAASLVPTFAYRLALGPSADLIVIAGLLGSARFVLSLCALDIGTSFGGIGASREALFASLAEPAFLMLIFTLALVAGSTQLPAVVEFLQSPAAGLRISLALGFAGLILIAIAENGRIPIDNPATHLELTMVHEAMVLEYSGRHLALIEYASALKLLLYTSLVVSVFMPWGVPPVWVDGLRYPSALGFYLAKAMAAAVLLGVFEMMVAKMRVFRVPEFIGSALMLTLLAVLLRLVSRSL